MSDHYFDKQDAIDYLIQQLGLKLTTDFSFKCANSDAYALLFMPYYVYHRGQKNKTPINRLMVNILFSIGNKFSYPTEEYILDAEIDGQSRYDFGVAEDYSDYLDMAKMYICTSTFIYVLYKPNAAF